MHLKTRILGAAAGFAALLALPAAASAAVNAVATGNVNMRTCGGTNCRVLATIPVGAPVVIYGCTGGYNWCDTQFGGYRGWVYGRYLQASAPGYAGYSPIPAIGALLGIAIIGGALANAYDYNHYGYGYPPYWGGGGYRPPYWGGGGNRPPYWGGGGNRPPYWGGGGNRPPWGGGYRPPIWSGNPGPGGAR
jgi:uncharacterized protein YraI